MLDDFTIDSLKEHLGTDFEVVSEGTLNLTLIFEDINIHINTREHQNFSLIFRGPLQPFLSQGIRLLRHPHFGMSEIFLVPVGKDQTGYIYEAVFNRIQPLE